MSEYKFSAITLALGYAFINGKMTDDEYNEAVSLLQYAADCVFRYEGLEF